MSYVVPFFETHQIASTSYPLSSTRQLSPVYSISNHEGDERCSKDLLISRLGLCGATIDLACIG